VLGVVLFLRLLWLLNAVFWNVLGFAPRRMDLLYTFPRVVVASLCQIDPSLSQAPTGSPFSDFRTQSHTSKSFPPLFPPSPSRRKAVLTQRHRPSSWKNLSLSPEWRPLSFWYSMGHPSFSSPFPASPVSPFYDIKNSPPPPTNGSASHRPLKF